MPNPQSFITNTSDYSILRAWVSPLLYTSFNLAMAQAVLVPLGSQTFSRKTIRWGGILGGIGVGFMLMSAHFAMSAHMPGIRQFEIPMGSIAYRLGALVEIIYILLIFMEIFSTFVADIYGVSLQIRQHIQISPKLITLFIMLTCFLISQFGFSSLLSVLYPIFGMLSLMWVGKLIIAGRGRPFRSSRPRSSFRHSDSKSGDTRHG